MLKKDHDKKLPSYDASNLAAGPSSSSAALKSEFGCISLNLSDRLRMINFPLEDIDHVRQIINTYWEVDSEKRGIQEERIYGGAPEFKLVGYPWLSTKAGKLKSANLICRVLETLYNRGWALTMSTDISNKEGSKDSLFFRHRSPAPPACYWMFISFDRADILRLSNVPKDGFDALFNIISSAYPIKKHQWLDDQANVYPTHEIKFVGFPLLPNGEATVHLRMFCLNLLGAVGSLGFSLYGSISHSQAAGSDNHGTDSWVFTRPLQWQPGIPAY